MPMFRGLSKPMIWGLQPPMVTPAPDYIGAATADRIGATARTQHPDRRLKPLPTEGGMAGAGPAAGLDEEADRQRAESASARGCVKTPKSRIAFPLEARIARLQCTLAPLPGQSVQALRARSPPARVFTQSGKVLGGGYRPGGARSKHSNSGGLLNGTSVRTIASPAVRATCAM